MKAIGLTVVVCGAPNYGKSGYIIEKIEESKRHNYIYDSQNEYEERLSFEALERTTLFYNLNNFRANIGKFRNSNIVVEEPLTFMRSFSEEDFLKVLASVCHHGNIVYFPFQVVHRVPLYVDDLCNYFVIFRTGDDYTLLKRSRPKLYAALSAERFKFPVTFCNIPPAY